MQPTKLKKLEQKLESQLPLIGGCLRQRTAKALALDGSPDAVRVLAKAVTRSNDRQVLAIALDALRQIRKQQCIDEVCAVWAITRHQDLADLLIKKGWVASAPVDIKVLSALKVEQLKVITQGGAEIVEALIKALRDNDREIAHRANQCITALKNPDAIDSLCERWMQSRNKQLEQAIVQQGYVGRKPIEVRVLSALKAGQRSPVIEGGAEIVEPLLNAFSDRDREIANRAKQYAFDLRKLEAQESLCRLVIEQDHQIARQVAINALYTPRDSKQQALFYFLTEQWDKYESLDFENTLLQTAYQVGDEQLRQRIVQKIRQSGRAEWVQIIAGGHKGKRLREMTHDEWETALEILNSGRKWEEMWRLAQIAPLIWSVKLLQRLKKAEWIPKTEFADLMQMGQKCGTDELDRLNSSLRCQATLPHRHSNRVSHLAISPDGKLLASSSSGSSSNGEVKLWSLPDGKLLQTLTEHRSMDIFCLAISSDNKLLASGGSDRTVRLWSLPDGELLQTLSEYRGNVYCLAISPDSKLLASGSGDKLVRLWSLPDGRPLQTLTGHSEAIHYLAISPDGKLLASSSDDTTVRLWSLPDGKPLQTLTGAGCGSLAISPDGKVLASSSTNTTVRLWSLPNGKLLQTLTKYHTNNHCRSPIAISPDGKFLASSNRDGGGDSTAMLWSLPDGKLLQTLYGHRGEIFCLAISPDSKLLASSGDTTIRLWSLPNGKPLQILTGDRGEASHYLAFSPDGKLLASGSDHYNSTVKLWMSGLYNLSRLPIEQVSAKDMQWVQEALQNKNISEAERNWLEFIQALINWRRRFDVVVEEAAQRINTGEFDIEIEGGELKSHRLGETKC